MSPEKEKALKGWDRRRRIKAWATRLDLISEWEDETDEEDPIKKQIVLLGAEARARLQLLDPTDGIGGESVEDTLRRTVERASK